MSAVENVAEQAELSLEASGESSFTLPGLGDMPRSCGEWFPSEFCRSCGEPHFIESRCNNRSCPECWWRWREDRAAAITRRLAAARHVGLWDETETYRCPETGRRGHSVDDCSKCGERPVEPEYEALKKRAVHATISPAPGVVETVEDVAEARTRAYELAREHGVRGGVVLFHPFRLTEAAKARWREIKGESEYPNRWAWVREQPDWRSLVEWAPHFHIIGLSDDFEPGDTEADDGWLVRNLRSLERFRIDQEGGYKDMFGLATYLLSHTGVMTESSMDSVTWYGALHPVNFNPDPTHPDRKLESPLDEREWRQIQHQVNRLTRHPDDSEGEAEAEPCDNCGENEYAPIFQAREALDRGGWASKLPREQQRRLLAAFEWAIGERKPPPGMKRPETKAYAKEALEVLAEA